MDGAKALRVLCGLVWSFFCLSSACEEHVLGILYSFPLDGRMAPTPDRPELFLDPGAWPSAEPQSRK